MPIKVRLLQQAGSLAGSCYCCFSGGGRGWGWRGLRRGREPTALSPRLLTGCWTFSAESARGAGGAQGSPGPAAVAGLCDESNATALWVLPPGTEVFNTELAVVYEGAAFPAALACFPSLPRIPGPPTPDPRFQCFSAVAKPGANFFFLKLCWPGSRQEMEN